MKQEILFNPIIIPDRAIPGRETQLAKPEIKTSRKKAAVRKSSRTANGRRVLDVAHSTVRFTARIRRQAQHLSQRIKGGLTSRFANLGTEKLKKVLIACGVAAALATAIIVMAKLNPLIIALLALLGLGAVLPLWARLRVMAS